MAFPLAASAYELSSQVGKGATATVYRGRCVPLDKVVAVKIIDLDTTSMTIEQFQRETSIMTRSNHHNVLQLHASFVHDNGLWLVLEFFPFGSLADVISASPAFNDGFRDFEPFLTHVLYQAVRALVYFHDNEQMHRDVKAANLLVDEDGTIAMADFGVSAEAPVCRGSISRKTFVGTPCWMAPEVLTMRGYRKSADIWSLGITALELAFGSPPYAHHPPMKVMALTLRGDPPSVDKCGTNALSPGFKDFVQLCLCKDPSARPTAATLLGHAFFEKVASDEAATLGVREWIQSHEVPRLKEYPVKGAAVKYTAEYKIANAVADAPAHRRNGGARHHTPEPAPRPAAGAAVKEDGGQAGCSVISWDFPASQSSFGGFSGAPAQGAGAPQGEYAGNFAGADLLFARTSEERDCSSAEKFVAADPNTTAGLHRRQQQNLQQQLQQPLQLRPRGEGSEGNGDLSARHPHSPIIAPADAYDESDGEAKAQQQNHQAHTWRTECQLTHRHCMKGYDKGDVMETHTRLTTYSAIIRATKERVALHEVEIDSGLYVEPILNEDMVETVLSISHDGLLSCREVWENGTDACYWVTESKEFGSLQTSLSVTGALDAPTVRKLSKPLAEGLNLLHGLGLMHRRVIPYCVYHTRLGNVKLGGVMAALFPPSGKISMKTVDPPSGVEAYLAPEQYEDDFDHKVDVYAFGLLLLEMLTAKQPYLEARNPMKLVLLKTKGTMPASLSLVTDTAFKDLITSCLSPAPLDRPTMAEVLEHAVFR
ncbi:Serine/threonine-protein kinase fray2 [Diplonema papillatum]|nr:Serine/threonine-protein kinase fray2 [Diplonema papillatum]